MKTLFPLLLLACAFATSCGTSRRAKQVAGPTQAERFDPATRAWVPATATMVRPATLPPSSLAAEKSAEGIKIIDSTDPTLNPKPETPEPAAPGTLKKVGRTATAPLRWMGLGKGDES